MPTYAPIHPERPLRRAAVAVVISLCVHAAALALLVAWALATLAAARKAEAERPREVALAYVDPARWEENRRSPAQPDLPERRQPQPRAQKVEPPAPSERSAVAMIAPGAEGRPRRQAAGEASAGHAPLAAAMGSQAKSAAGGDEATPLAPGGTLDLQPRPQASRPLAMRFDPVGKGPAPFTEGTSFAGLTVQTPEAWRFTNFFGRAVEAMNSVYRYELGAPMPPSLHAQWLANPRRGGGCSMTSVSIDAAGKVLEASVRRSSGMPDLDALIVEVIRRTAPFVNVPPELVGGRGTYSDTWGLCIMWGGGRG